MIGSRCWMSGSIISLLLIIFSSLLIFHPSYWDQTNTIISSVGARILIAFGFRMSDDVWFMVPDYSKSALQNIRSSLGRYIHKKNSCTKQPRLERPFWNSDFETFRFWMAFRFPSSDFDPPLYAQSIQWGLETTHCMVKEARRQLV